MMSEGILTQEEIEVLLSGKTLEDNPVSPDSTGSNENYLTEMEKSALGEIGNISFGSSATALSALLGQKVDITTPTVSVVEQSAIEAEFIHPYVAIKVEYTEGLIGMNLLVIKQSDAAIIADLMLGGDGVTPNPELGEIHLSAVQEAMNQMMGSAATSMSTMFNIKVDISPPTIDLLDLQLNTGAENIPQTNPLIKVAFSLLVGDLIDSEIMQLLPFEFGKEIVTSLLGESMEEESVATVAEVPYAAEEKAKVAPIQTNAGYAPTLEAPPKQQRPQVEVQNAQFASFEDSSLNQVATNNLDLLLDIPLKVTVELGRTKRSIKEILEMSSGSIIELDKLAGEPVDILVNNRLIANGEVVVIDENFGVRITDILSQTERIQNLR